MGRRCTILVSLFAATLAARSYTVDGIVVAVDPVARTMLVSHRPIGAYMGAMTMPFRVEDAGELQGLHAGARIQFELIVAKDRSIARAVRLTGAGDVEIPPPLDRLRIGDRLPDFQLSDQQGRPVRLADLKGKVVAINFLYTRCPLPDVCPRLAANFAALQRRFADHLGTDLVLLSITVDPEYDTIPVLADYARRWSADSHAWRFLTGEVAAIAARLGEVYWADEGSIGHNSITSVVDRQGRLAAAIDGAAYRPDQLSSLIAHELEKSQ